MPAKAKANQCSPTHQDVFKQDRTCLTKEELVRLVTAYNRSRVSGNAKHLAVTGTKAALWTRLDERMRAEVGAGNEAAWADRLPAQVKDAFTPKKPAEWAKNEYTWLTNLDIDRVMRQYEQEPSYTYKYLGALSVDFATAGQCDYYADACKLDFAELKRRKVRYAGMVINTDPHDEPGQHWISLFIVADPSLPSYGAYFYDSVADAPPPEVKAYMLDLRKRNPNANRKFRLAYSGRRMQWKNTECGVFSMAYQVRWLNMLRAKHGQVDMKLVVDQKIDDDDIHQLRDVLFR